MEDPRHRELRQADPVGHHPRKLIRPLQGPPIPLFGGFLADSRTIASAGADPQSDLGSRDGQRANAPTRLPALRGRFGPDGKTVLAEESTADQGLGRLGERGVPGELSVRARCRSSGCGSRDGKT